MRLCSAHRIRIRTWRYGLCVVSLHIQRDLYPFLHSLLPQDVVKAPMYNRLHKPKTPSTKIDKNGNAIFGQEAAPKSAAIEEPRTQASTESQEAATPSAPTEPATPSSEELATADVEPVTATEVAVADAIIEETAPTAKQTVETKPPTIKERPVVSQPRDRHPRSSRRSGDALQKSRRKKRQKPNNALRKRNERKLNKPKLRELRKQSVVRISKKRKMLKSSARRMLRPN